MVGLLLRQVLLAVRYLQNAIMLKIVQASCQIGDIGGYPSVCVYSLGTFSVICAELLPQELTSVSPHVIIAQSDYEEWEGEGERSRSRRSG